MKTYKKFNWKQILVLIWMGISFYSVMIFAEADFWILALIIASFGLSGYIANRMDWTGTEMDNDGRV